MPMFHRRPAFAMGVCAVLLAASPALGQTAKDAIGGTGRIEPRGGVVMLSGAQGATIKAIRVHVGDVVKSGTLLATLDDSSARAQQEIAQMAYNQAKMAGEQGIANQAMTVRIAEQKWKQAKAEADAYRALGPTATSQRQIAASDTAAFEARAAYQAEQLKAKQLRANVDIQSAARRLKVANDTLATYQVRAPSNGTILRIDQRAGENANGPILELGDISVMYVVCQVFQGDLLKIKPGMKARINNSALGRELSGTVEQVSRLVDTKAQLGDVRIRLDDTNLASRVVGMEVEVKIAR